MVRENNQRDSKTFVYNYDLGGNLLSKIEYAYTTGEDLGIPVNTISYAYGDANWKDLMTSFDGKAITYDAIGNPLTYDGSTFAWEGRKLTSFNKTGLAVSYTYNENGIRTSKTVNGIPTTYRLSGDKVTFEQTGADTIYYVYDTQGQLISMILNNVEYAYLRNAQNDIIGLINSAGVQVVAYTYSAWGEVLSITGSLASTIGQQNPYRYRGYRYDSETGLYYLQSRYYNPQWGRFLNADSIVASQGSIFGVNFFQYCKNNAVLHFDENGESEYQLKRFTIGQILGILAILSLAAQNQIADAFKEFVNNSKVRPGEYKGYSLYVLHNPGKVTEVRYVGITNSPKRRSLEHQRNPDKVGLEMKVVKTGMSKGEARLAEQALVSTYTLSNLLNRRREIARGNIQGAMKYDKAISEMIGDQLLQKMDDFLVR